MAAPGGPIVRVHRGVPGLRQGLACDAAAEQALQPGSDEDRMAAAVVQQLLREDDLGHRGEHRLQAPLRLLQLRARPALPRHVDDDAGREHAAVGARPRRRTVQHDALPSVEADQAVGDVVGSPPRSRSRAARKPAGVARVHGGGPRLGQQVGVVADLRAEHRPPARPGAHEPRGAVGGELQHVERLVRLRELDPVAGLADVERDPVHQHAAAGRGARLHAGRARAAPRRRGRPRGTRPRPSRRGPAPRASRAPSPDRPGGGRPPRRVGILAGRAARPSSSSSPGPAKVSRNDPSARSSPA